MTQRSKRSLIRFGKVFVFSFLAIFVYLAKPILEAISVKDFSLVEILNQLWVVAQVAAISGIMGALEKYASWKPVE